MVGLGIGVITSPITTRLLTVEQYGAIPLLGAVWSIATIVQFAGMDSAYLLYRARGTHDNHVLVATSTIVASLSAIVVWGLFCLFAIGTGWLAAYASVTKVELIAFLLSVLPNALVAWHLQLLRMMHQAAAFATVTIIGRIAGAIVVIPVMYFLPQEQRLAGSLFTYSILSFFSYFLAVRLMKSGGIDPHARKYYSPSLVRPMATLGTALIPGALVYSLFAVADRLILGWYSSNAEVAVFALAGSVASVALVFKAAFSRTWDPHTVTWIGTRDNQVYLPRLQAAANVIAPLVAISTFLAVAWGDTLFKVVFPSAYSNAGRILPILVLAGTLATLTLVANLAELISSKARYRLPIYATGLAINIAICLVFVPRYGAYAAALGTLAGETTILLLWIVLGKWLLRNLLLDWSATWLSLGISLAVCLAYRPGDILGRHPLFEQLLITALCVAATWILGRRAVTTFAAFSETKSC